MLRWAQGFQGENSGKQPTHLQIREQANAMLMQVIIDPPGMGNLKTGTTWNPATL